MKRKLIAMMATMFALAIQTPQANAADLRLIGSGASFPFPLYSAWFKDFSKKTAGVTVDYQAKGSGAGIQDLINKTVDFAASDAAMTPAEIAKVVDGVVLLPMTAGEIVLAYNLPGQPKNLKLPRDVYPDIFLGKITRWNDPRIIAANPDLSCRICPSPWSGVRIQAARLLSSPSISARSVPHLKPRSVQARTSNGRRAIRSSRPRRTTA